MDRLNLDGFCVGVTADRRAEEQIELLRRRGASVVHGPSIRTLPLGADAACRSATEDLIARPPHALIANTGIGIRAWFAAADSWGLGGELTDALADARILARGPKAAGAIHAVGLEVAGRAPNQRLREVVDELVARPVAGRRVAVQLDGGARPDDLDRLRSAGADVVEVPVYEWRLPSDDRPVVRLAEAVIAGRVHALTFTSGPALRNMVAIAAEHDLADDLLASIGGDATVVACVGPVCAEAAEELGITDSVVPGTSRLGPLIRALAERLVARTVQVPVGDGALILRGTVAELDGERVELSDTEARLLAVLAERPGAVVAKAVLLARAWGQAAGDPHLVEVTVARLRRRLAGSTVAIEAVPRRGYRLVPAVAAGAAAGTR